MVFLPIDKGHYMIPAPLGAEIPQNYHTSLLFDSPNTVDGQNPAPPRIMIIPLFIGF